MIKVILAIRALILLAFVALLVLMEVLSSPTVQTYLKDFKHYLANMWNEYNCTVVGTFFNIALIWDWNENGPFPVLWPLLSFPNVLAY